MSTLPQPYSRGPGSWSTIEELLQLASNYDFASGQKMTIKGTVCGDVANASSVQGNGNYSNTGTVGGIEWVGPAGPIHSTYTSQAFNCQWYTPFSSLPPGCNPDPKNEPSDQLFVDIAIASNTAKNLTPTQTFSGIDTDSGDVVINVISGLNVINVPPNPFGNTEGKLQVRGGGDLIINGPSDAVVIFNVGADDEVNTVSAGMSIQNGRSILTTGGLQAEDILFNVIGGDITINAGVVNGSILVRAGSDVKGKADIQGTSIINGIVIGDGNHSSQFSLDTNAAICSPFDGINPAIDLEKLVSADGGTTFDDADTPTGPIVVMGTDPVFRFVVTNTGNETLTNIDLVDSDLGPITIPTTTLAPGESFQVDVTGTWAAGQQFNEATVSGDGTIETVIDTDPAYYFGAFEPSIDLEKLVSPDGGITFFDADTPPGPAILQGTDPIFRFIVTNNGNETINNITLNDSVLGNITIPTTTLDPGESFQVDVTGTWAVGQKTNLAEVTGDGTTTTLSDTDPANYVGTTAAIDLEKQVSPDGGTTFFDADTPPGPDIEIGTDPVFRYIVENIGNETLNNIELIDSELGPITIPTTTLAPGESFQVDVTGTWAPGQQLNEATVTGDGDLVTVTDTDPAYYFGLSEPAIDVEKFVSPDGGTTFIDADTPPGPTIFSGTDPIFKYVVINTGNEPLTEVTLIDSDLGPLTTPTDTLTPAESFEVFVTGNWNEGQQFNTATVEGTGITITVTDTDPAYYLGANKASLDIEKFVSVDNGETFEDADTPPGPYLNPSTDPIFRYVVTNNGNTPLTDIVVTDSELGFVGNIPFLNPGDSAQFEVIGTAEIGQQSNVGFAEGTFDDDTVSDSDLAHYFGIPECFTQIMVNGDLIIPEQKPDVERVVDFHVNPEVNDIDIIDTIDGTKIIISGFIEIGITYVADNEVQSEHFAHFRVPFTATLVCPDISVDAKVKPIIIIEHVQWHIIDPRTIKKNIVLLVGVKEIDC